jgi:hypothetical protein
MVSPSEGEPLPCIFGRDAAGRKRWDYGFSTRSAQRETGAGDASPVAVVFTDVSSNGRQNAGSQPISKEVPQQRLRHRSRPLRIPRPTGRRHPGPTGRAGRRPVGRLEDLRTARGARPGDRHPHRCRTASASGVGTAAMRAASRRAKAVAPSAPARRPVPSRSRTGGRDSFQSSSRRAWPRLSAPPPLAGCPSSRLATQRAAEQSPVKDARPRRNCSHSRKAALVRS